MSSTASGWIEKGAAKCLCGMDLLNHCIFYFASSCMNAVSLRVEDDLLCFESESGVVEEAFIFAEE